jgi:hypothetical protein
LVTVGPNRPFALQNLYLQFKSGRRLHPNLLIGGLFRELIGNSTASLEKRARRSADAALGFLDPAMVSRDPERVARRVSLRLLSRARPGPLRNALWLARGIARFGLRQWW